MPRKRAVTKIQTTLRLPRALHDQARKFVEASSTNAQNLNDFIVAALRAYVKLLERRQIDAAFAGMAEDANHHREAQLIAEEFEQSDWEALELAEKQSVDADASR